MPSLRRILFNDQIASLAWLFPLMMALFGATGLGLLAFLSWASGTDFSASATLTKNLRQMQTLLYLALAGLAVGLPVLAWRIATFRALFANGVRVPGVVTKLGAYKAADSLSYSYVYQGQRYAGAHDLLRTSRDIGFTVNQAVTVVVDPTNPRRSAVVEVLGV